MYRTFKSKDWSPTTFVVNKSRISYSSGGSDQASHYKTWFELEYQVGGKSYESNCSDLNLPLHSTKEDAEKYLKKVCDGKFGNDIFYNPHNPSEAYLKPGIKYRYILPISFGFGMIIVPYLTIIGTIEWE